MKRTIILLSLIFAVLTVNCQNKDKIFNTLIRFNQGIQFGDGTIQLTAATGTGGSVTWDAILNKPLTFPPSAHAHDALYRPISYVPTWTEVTGKPTTLSGYGITDAATLTHNHAGTYESVLGNPLVSGYVLTSTTSGTRSWAALPTGGSITYPSAGIPLSTGSAWGTSIVNNSTNWNAAYSWGNHAGLYRPITYVPSWTEVTAKPTTFAPAAHNQEWSTITGTPTTLAGYGITDASSVIHTHSLLYKPLDYIPTWAEILNKPIFATVATTGSFNDLADVPEMIELEVALPLLNGISLPVLTQTQINALTPTKGLILFNDTDGVLQIYTGTVWKILATTNQ